MTTNKKRVLKLLQGGGKFSTIDFVKLANVADPHKVISYLRDEGYRITDEWVKRNGKKYKLWKLEK